LVDPGPRKILQSIENQENIPVTSSEKAAVLLPDAVSDSLETNSVMNKRLSTAASNYALAKKSKVAKTAPKPKIIPLQKGQKKLNAFFRM